MSMGDEFAWKKSVGERWKKRRRRRRREEKEEEEKKEEEKEGERKSK